MFSLSILYSCLVLFFAVAKAEDVTLSDDVSGASAKVLGQSGKIDFSLDGQTMQVTMSSLTEVDSNGDAVGTTGSADEKHTFNSFASKDFVFSEVFSEDYQGLNTTRVNFTCVLFAGATNLQVQLILFLEEGNVDVNNATFAVDRGSFKYTYNIDYWPFCTVGGSGNSLCQKGQTEQEGAFLDFEIIMKSSSTSNPAVSSEDQGNATAVVVDWSEGGEMAFPGQYEEVSTSGERVWKDLPTGYPLFEQQGGSDVTTLRFTRFDAAIDYDPIMTLPKASESTDEGDGDDDDICFHVESIIDYKGVEYTYEELKAGKEPECTVPHSPFSKGVVISTSCDKTVRVTDTHLMATSTGFQLAYSLKAGDVLFGDYSSGHCVVKSVEKEKTTQQYFGLNCVHSEVLASGLRASTFGDFHTLPSWYMTYVGGLVGSNTASFLGEYIAEWYFGQ